MRQKRYRRSSFPFFPLFFILLYSGATIAFCQDSRQNGYRIERVLFIPPDFYVGDEIEMRIVLKLEDGVSLQPPKGYPTVNWMRYSDVRIQEKEAHTYEVRVFFSPYFTGTRTMAPLVLGDITLDTIKIRTRSVIEDGEREFAAPAGQAYLPGTRLFLAIGIGFLLVIPLLFITLGGRLRRGIADVLARKRIRKPYKQFLASIAALEEQAHRFSARSFYISLTEEFRRYLTARTKKDFFSLTTVESKILFEDLIPDKELLQRLSEVLSNSDGAKFAARDVPLEVRSEDLRFLKAVGDTVERSMGGVHVQS